MRGGKSAIHKSHKPIHPEDPRVQCIRVKCRSKDGVLRWVYRVSMLEEHITNQLVRRITWRRDDSAGSEALMGTFRYDRTRNLHVKCATSTVVFSPDFQSWRTELSRLDVYIFATIMLESIASSAFISPQYRNHRNHPSRRHRLK